MERCFYSEVLYVEAFIDKIICIANRVVPASPTCREEVVGRFVFWDLKQEKKR